MNLNVGCGGDDWGDVRLDVAKKYMFRNTVANIFADAENLPFKNRCFTRVRAHHILEHLPDWKKAIEEWCRVTRNKLEVIVPMDAGGLERELLAKMFSLNVIGILTLPQRRREHLWKFNPKAIVEQIRKNGFDAKLETVVAPLVFRDDNRLSKARFVKWIRRREKKLKFAYRIVSQRK